MLFILWVNYWQAHVIFVWQQPSKSFNIFLVHLCSGSGQFKPPPHHRLWFQLGWVSWHSSVYHMMVHVFGLHWSHWISSFVLSHLLYSLALWTSSELLICTRTGHIPPCRYHQCYLNCSNIVFHERPNHNEADCHFIHEVFVDDIISVPHLLWASDLCYLHPGILMLWVWVPCT